MFSWPESNLLETGQRSSERGATGNLFSQRRTRSSLKDARTITASAILAAVLLRPGLCGLMLPTGAAGLFKVGGAREFHS